MQSHLYEHLLPTLGARIMPALFRRLRKVAEEGDEYKLYLVIEAVTSIETDEVGRHAAELLLDTSPSVQHAAIKVLAKRPCMGCLDRLWEIHCKMWGEQARSLKEQWRPRPILDDLI